MTVQKYKIMLTENELCPFDQSNLRFLYFSWNENGFDDSNLGNLSRIANYEFNLNHAQGIRYANALIVDNLVEI